MGYPDHWVHDGYGENAGLSAHLLRVWQNLVQRRNAVLYDKFTASLFLTEPYGDGIKDYWT